MTPSALTSVSGLPPRGRASILAVLLLGCLGPLSLLRAADETAEWEERQPGLWSDASNWSTAAFPNNNAITYDVLLLKGGFAETDVDITLDVDATIDNLTTTSGVRLSGPGDLTIEESWHWISALVGGSGTIRVADEATVILGTSASDRRLLPGRTLENRGLARWLASGMRQDAMTTFDNQGTFSFEVGGTYHQVNSVGDGALPAVFNNSGLLEVLPGISFAAMEVRLVNSGEVRIEGALFELSGGGVSTGGFFIQDGSQFNPRTFTFDPGTAIGGGGTLLVTDTLTLKTAVAPTRVLQFSGGVLTGDGTMSPVDTYTWTSGVIEGAGGLDIGPAATLQLEGGSAKTLRGPLANAGTTRMSGSGNLRLGAGASIENTGSFIFNSSASIARQPGDTSSLAVRNNGVLVNQSGNSSIGVPLENSGTLEAFANRLTLSGGGFNQGKMFIFPDAEIWLQEDFTLREGSLLFGGGGLRINSGTLTLESGSEVVAAITLTSGGAIQSPSGGTDLAGGLNWRSGEIAGGKVSIPENTSAQLTTTAVKDLSGVLESQGTIEFDAGNLRFGDGALLHLKGGTLVLNGSANLVNQPFSDGGVFETGEGATVVKTGAATSTVAVPVDLGDSTIRVLEGPLRLLTIPPPPPDEPTPAIQWEVGSDGRLEVPNNFHVNRESTLSGSGVVQSPEVVIDGTLAPEPGNLAFDGSVFVNDTMLFGQPLDSGAPNSSVQVDGTMTLGPNSVLDVWGGEAGKSYTIITCGNLEGGFNKITPGYTIESHPTSIAVTAVTPALPRDYGSYAVHLIEDPEKRGFEDTPPGGVIPNGLAYALNLRPGENPASAGPKPEWRLPVHTLIVTYNPRAEDVTMTVEGSADLEFWWKVAQRSGSDPFEVVEDFLPEGVQVESVEQPEAGLMELLITILDTGPGSEDAAPQGSSAPLPALFFRVSAEHTPAKQD
ncbi:MAG: hypothetical protein EA425_03595 [Puniceicoccaceae bacterium]|nr:MAG: hypothetical protein EA425_03595 [Puniceicoccaceae bacterium]